MRQAGMVGLGTLILMGIPIRTVIPIPMVTAIRTTTMTTEKTSKMAGIFTCFFWDGKSLSGSRGYALPLLSTKQPTLLSRSRARIITSFNLFRGIAGVRSAL